MSDETASSKPQEGEPAGDTEQRIRERAHKLWESEGKQDGKDEEYWHRARELIEDEDKSSYPPAQSRGHRF